MWTSMYIIQKFQIVEEKQGAIVSFYENLCSPSCRHGRETRPVHAHCNASLRDSFALFHEISKDLLLSHNKHNFKNCCEQCVMALFVRFPKQRFSHHCDGMHNFFISELFWVLASIKLGVDVYHCKVPCVLSTIE